MRRSIKPVEAACAEALKEGVHSADVILNILARRRDPGPPVTIMTPEVLRLRHEQDGMPARGQPVASAAATLPAPMITTLIAYIALYFYV